MSFDREQAIALLGDVFAPWIQDLDLAIENIDDNGATLLLPFSASLCREGGILCGQSLMALADTAAVFAISAASDGYRPMTTVDQSIHLLKPVSNQAALAQARVVRLGRTMAFVRVDISGADDGKAVALAQIAYALGR